MLALLKADQFPSFALAFYEPLHLVGADQPPPRQLALVAEDAILLAPRFTPRGWQGFLIAEHTAAGQARAFRWPGDPGPAAVLVVPPPSGEVGAVWAEEAAYLTTPPSPPAPAPPQSPPP